MKINSIEFFEDGIDIGKIVTKFTNIIIETAEKKCWLLRTLQKKTISPVV